MKVLLGKELHLENGSLVDGAEQNGKANGFANGSHKEDEDVNMATEQDETETKSPAAPKGKGGRRSKANSETKS